MNTKRAAPRATASARPEEGPAAGVRLGTFTARLAALDPRGRAWITWEEDAAPESGTNGSGCSTGRASARTTVPLVPAHVGREVLVTWANEPPRAVIVGLLQPEVELEDESPPAPDAADLDVKRRRALIESEEEIVLRCGAGSITLTADGKVQIRGLDVVSSAERTQRIRGGSVRIN